MILKGSSASLCPSRRGVISISRGATHHHLSRRRIRSRDSGNGGNQLGDDLLDFIQAGRKLRRWYGEGERVPRGSSQGGPDPSEQEEEEQEEGGDAVLVTDAEGPAGEQVVLQLILARANVKVLVRDVVAAKSAYGPYVTPVSADIGDASALKRTLRGVSSVVAVGRLGALPQVLGQLGPNGKVTHVCLLSTAGTGSGGGLLGMFRSAEDTTLADPSREAAISSCGVPYSIVRTARIQQTPGGQSRVALVQEKGGGALSPVSCEDLAAVLVAALDNPPSSSGRRFAVTNSSAGGQLPGDDWTAAFQQLQPEAS